MSEIIRVENLSKIFKTRKASSGILKNLISPQRQIVQAVNAISFSIKAGERVAFIGPNGAGKSTTIKMLTGILHPTSGNMTVLGHVPWKERRALSYKMGTVFGQRSQLWYHLPASDTFQLLAKIYEIDSVAYKRQMETLLTLFELSPYLHKPVRQLSLGERMRCEIVASLLHNPKILFLDEPTIGLDINAKLLIRNLLNKLSKDYGTTLFLTSHDTADIEQVCDRVIILDKGAIIADTTLYALKKSIINKKILTVTTEQEKLSLNFPGIKIVENDSFNFRCEVENENASLCQIIAEVLKVANLKDITVEDVPMEEIIRLLYQAKA